MGITMPYHLEKGPTFSVLEANRYQTTNRQKITLEKLRERDASGAYVNAIPDLTEYKAAELDAWATYEWRKMHMNVHWFGMTHEDGPRNTHVYKRQPPFDPHHPKSTGYWHNYYGDVEGIMRQALIRAYEVALGLEHDAPVDQATRNWPISYHITCPAAWFEAWVTWRKITNGGRGGHVLIHIVSPAHLHDAAQSSTSFPDLKNPRDGYVLPSPLSPPQKGGDVYAENPKDCSGQFGMWIITHKDHDAHEGNLTAKDETGAPVTTGVVYQSTTSAVGQGEWIFPNFGLYYEGKGEIVCVQPAEADGGVRPQGRGNG